MWHDHTFSQRKKATKRAEGWTKSEKGDNEYTGSS